MKRKTYLLVASFVFAILAIAHALRIAFGWEVELDGALIPMWPSWVAVALAGYLALRGFSHVRCKSLKCSVCR